MFAGQVDELPPPLGGERPAARILERGNRVQEPRLRAARESLLQRVRVEPFVIHRHRGHVDAARGEQLQGTVVRRRLDQHAPAGKVVGQERDALQRAVGDEHAGGVDAVPLSDPVPQRLIAAHRPVREHGRTVAFDRRACTVGQLLDRDALGSGDAAREGDRLHASSVGV